MSDPDPMKMQPAELEAALSLPPGSTNQHEWVWMRQVVRLGLYHAKLQRQIIELSDMVIRLTEAQQKDRYYVGRPKGTP